MIGYSIFEFGNLSTPTAKNSSLSTWFLFSFPMSSKDKLKAEFLRHICTVRYVWDDLIRNSKSSLPIFQIMLDELEEELLLLDEVNRKENFTFMDNITMEENSNRTGIQVKCRYMMNDDMLRYLVIIIYQDPWYQYGDIWWSMVLVPITALATRS